MSYINNIKNFVGNIYLNKHKKNVIRERSISNLDNAKNIGIIYVLQDELIYNHILRFVKLLQDKQINVKAIGYFEGNIRPIYAIERLSLDFYDNKDLNWFNKPKSSYVDDFINNEFDILIDLTMDDLFQTQYISSLSKARFKVGKGGINKEEIYDLMIDINPHTSIDEFITLIIHYLSIINKKD